MPNIKISDLQPIAGGFDPDAVFLEAQQTVAGEEVSRKISVTEVTAGAGPLAATYVTVTANAILPNERILTAGADIDIVDGGAGGNITISLTAGASYFQLTATGRVIGSDAGTSNTGDNVILGGALAGDLNIADGVIALGQNALAIATELDFVGSIAIGRNAGANIGDTRDPWIIIGDGAAGNVVTRSFHDGNTIIGTRALGALAGTANVQNATIIGHDAASDMTGASGLGVVNSAVIIGSDAGTGNVGASITTSVLIGSGVCNDLRTGGVAGAVVIGNNTGESLGGAVNVVLIGSNNTAAAVNIDDSIVIGCNTFGISVAQTANQIIIGHSSVPSIVAGEKNVLIGNAIGISGAQADFDGCVIIGQGAGNNLIDDQDIFAIEVPQAGTSNVARPFLFGNFLNGNLALLNIEAMTGGSETGTRIVPAWADAAPVAGQGVFSMYGAGTDLAATTDTDFVHMYVRSADNNMMFRFEDGSEIALSSAGFTVAGIGFIRSVGNTDAEARFLSYQHADGTQRAFTGHDNDDVFNIVNEIDGGNLEFFATDIGSVLRPILVGDPDVDTTLTGDVDLNLDATTNVNFNINSSPAFVMTFQLLQGATASSAALRHDTAATTTTPTVLPGQDFDTGLGGAGNSISVIVEGIQYMLLDRLGNEEQITLSPGANLGDAADPFLAWGDGDSGWYEETDDEISLAILNQEQFSVGLDGKLFVNTLTGVGFQGGNIISATPGLVSIYGARTATNGISGGAVEIWGGYAAGTAPGVGGDVGIWGGGAGGGAKTGGSVNLFGGDADAVPGEVTIIGGTATVGGDGGNVTIDGGPGFGAGTRDGGEVNITGGPGVDAGLGGNLNIAAGAGAGVGTGGVIQISAGDSVSGAAGILQLNGGDVATSGLGGRIVLVSGDGGAASDRGGDIWITVGQGNVTGASGNIYINSTDGTTSAAAVSEQPGLVAIFGIEGTGVTAGDIQINGALSTGGATGDGGDVLIEGGSSANTNGDAGDIVLTLGTGNGSGTDGQVIVDPALTGTVALPALAFGDGDTGLFESADDVLNIVTLGLSRMTVNASGLVSVGTGGISTTGDLTMNGQNILSANNIDASTDLLLRVNTSENGIAIRQNGGIEFFFDNVETADVIDSDVVPVGFQIRTIATTFHQPQVNRVLRTENSAAYTYVLQDAVEILQRTGGTAFTHTIPLNSSVAFPEGTILEVTTNGGAIMTLTPTGGVTLRWSDTGAGGTGSHIFTSHTNGIVRIRKIGTDLWLATLQYG